MGGDNDGLSSHRNGGSTEDSRMREEEPKPRARGSSRDNKESERDGGHRGASSILDRVKPRASNRRH